MFFERKIFITAKVRELTPEGEQKLTDFTRPTYLAMLDELGKELGADGLEKLAPDERPNDDQLTRALGRPNREQVVTRRESGATTLQAIEMTNGDTLDRKFKKGSQHWLTTAGADSDKIIKGVYRAALSRLPNAGEFAAAKRLLGRKPTKEAVEDLLWVITMLPEFQLIY